MADIKQITEIDLELAKEMGGVNEKLQNLLEKQKEGREETNKELSDINSHLKTLNGSVASHEGRLNDFGSFKTSLLKAADEQAKKTAQRAASIRSVSISVVIPIATILLIWLFQKLFHVQLPSI